MTLKNVVLPAPLGPMRLTIEPSGMSKSIVRTATRPPKRFEIPRASSRRPRLAGSDEVVAVRQARPPARPVPRVGSAWRRRRGRIRRGGGIDAWIHRLGHPSDRSSGSIRAVGSAAVSSSSAGVSWSSRRLRRLGNRPSGLNSIIPTSARPYSRYW